MADHFISILDLRTLGMDKQIEPYELPTGARFISVHRNSGYGMSQRFPVHEVGDRGFITLHNRRDYVPMQNGGFEYYEVPRDMIVGTLRYRGPEVWRLVDVLDGQVKVTRVVHDPSTTATVAMTDLFSLEDWLALPKAPVSKLDTVVL
jgi:hypothetical protein